MRRIILILMLVIVAGGCNTADSPVDGDVRGCVKDTDCKGDRICIHGECVAPGDGDAIDATEVEELIDVDTDTEDETEPERDTEENTEEESVDNVDDIETSDHGEIEETVDGDADMVEEEQEAEIEELIPCSYTNPCQDDGLWCNGEEVCIEYFCRSVDPPDPCAAVSRCATGICHEPRPGRTEVYCEVQDEDVLEGWCVLDSHRTHSTQIETRSCLPDRTIAPSGYTDECGHCDSALDKTHWSPASEGTKVCVSYDAGVYICDDNGAWRKQDPCEGHVCEDGECIRPDYLGERCQSKADCQDGSYCNGEEQCIEGICVVAEPEQMPCIQESECANVLCLESYCYIGTVDPGKCQIGEQCLNDGEPVPNVADSRGERGYYEGCFYCDAENNPKGMTRKAEGSSCGLEIFNYACADMGLYLGWGCYGIQP